MEFKVDNSRLIGISSVRINRNIMEFKVGQSDSSGIERTSN